MPRTTTTILAECGHELQVGERAYSHYTCTAGVIEQRSPAAWNDWFDFRQDDGRSDLLNGERVCCLACARRFGYSNAV